MSIFQCQCFQLSGGLYLASKIFPLACYFQELLLFLHAICFACSIIAVNLELPANPFNYSNSAPFGKQAEGIRAKTPFRVAEITG